VVELIKSFKQLSESKRLIFLHNFYFKIKIYPAAIYYFGGTALRAVYVVGAYGGNAPVSPHYSVCEAYAPNSPPR
jgi:hypothetical protein